MYELRCAAVVLASVRGDAREVHLHELIGGDDVVLNRRLNRWNSRFDQVEAARSRAVVGDDLRAEDGNGEHDEETFHARPPDAQDSACEMREVLVSR